jgi:hypothetical protein
VCTSVCFAQSTLDAAGGDDDSVTGSLSFSIGQPFYQSFQVAQTISVEGVQQPHIILADDLPGVTNEFGEILVYPNPARDEVWIELSGTLKGTECLVIYDVTGREVSEVKLTHSQIMVDVSMLATACYSFCFYADRQLVRQMRILKIN